jgi:hypothetical protein
VRCLADPTRKSKQLLIDQQNRDKRRAKYALKIQQITVVDIEGLDSLGIEQLKEQLRYWKDKCATWDGAFPKMMKAVQIGKTPPLYATADYQTEKERILYVLKFTLRMQVGGARRGICAGNEFDRFVKGPQPPWSQQPSDTVIVPTHQKDWSAM